MSMVINKGPENYTMEMDLFHIKGILKMDYQMEQEKLSISKESRFKPVGSKESINQLFTVEFCILNYLGYLILYNILFQMNDKLHL